MHTTDTVSVRDRSACRRKGSNLCTTFCCMPLRLFLVSCCYRKQTGRYMISRRLDSTMFLIPLIRSEQSCPTPTPIHFLTSLFTLVDQYAPALDLPAFLLEQQFLDRPLRSGMYHVISGRRLDRLRRQRCENQKDLGTRFLSAGDDE